MSTFSSRRISAAFSACVGCPRRAAPWALNSPNNWSSRSFRSVSMTMVGFLSALASCNWRTKNNIVSDLPEPCVCQTTPPLRAPPAPDAAIVDAKRFSDRVELMIAGELLRLDDAVDDLEGDIVDDEVEKSFWRENATDQHFEFRPPFVFEFLAVDSAPGREAVEPGGQRSDASRDAIADDQRLIEAHAAPAPWRDSFATEYAPGRAWLAHPMGS